jgi:hypothetical protein
VAEGLWDGDARVLPVERAGLGADAGIVGAALAAGAQVDDRQMTAN